MDNDDFKAGEVAADVRNINREVVDIKAAMKDHNTSDKEEFGNLNDKADKIADATQKAAEVARSTAVKVDEQEKINDKRHEENKTKLDTIIDNQQSTAVKLAKYGGMAVVLGGVGGYLIPLAIHYFFKI